MAVRTEHVEGFEEQARLTLGASQGPAVENLRTHERPPHELLRPEEITRSRTWIRVEPAAP